MQEISAASKNVMVAVLVTVFSLASVLLTASPVIAQERTNEIEETVVSACTELESKLSEVVTSFENKKSQHSENYEKLSTLYGEITTKLGEANYKVAVLRELHPGLERRIVHFEEVSTSFIAEVGDVRDSACRDKLSFNQELEEARESLKKVQSSVNDISQYVQAVLLPTVSSVVETGVN